jgi:hypothetical protein
VKDLALFGGGDSSAVVDMYNATSNNWTTASLTQARANLAATSVYDIALFGGGYDGISTSTSYAVVDMLVTICTSNANCSDNGVFCDGFEVCISGICTHTGDPCLEQDICNSTCNETMGTCVLGNNKFCASDIDCDDNIFCNGKETCQYGCCMASTGNPCTYGTFCNKTCNETAKNCFAPKYFNCSDGIFCNGEEVCIQGICISPEPRCENNTNPCNTCQEGLQACYIPIGSICPMDGNQCGICKDNDGNGTCTSEAGIECQSVVVKSIVHGSTNDVPVITGSVVGGIAVVALIIIVAVYLHKKQRQPNDTNSTEQQPMELGVVVSTLKDVTVMEKIGGGAFGEVYRGLMNVICDTASY